MRQAHSNDAARGEGAGRLSRVPGSFAAILAGSYPEVPPVRITIFNLEPAE